MEAPHTVGPYLIEEPLVGGAMGTVYRARHRENGELVALKSVAVPVRVQLASLRREVQALQAIEHPNVVGILDHGSDPIPWYTMELVEGLTLSAHMRNAPVEQRWRQYLPAVCEVCNGLAYLHGLGMVHRDLKPANIMIRRTEGPDPGQAVLVDFGLATVSAGGAGRELLYKRSEVVGTPQYISPEQVQQLAVDARTDLYSLGCILFELLAGQPPFPAPVPIVGMLRHINDVPIFPDAVVERTPPEIRELILALLEKRPQDRPGYAVDVRDRLAEIGGFAAPRDVPEPAGYLYRPRLVGREDLDDDLRALADEFPTTGKLVVVRGAAGSGKSRLAIEMIRRIHIATEAGVEVLMAESTPDDVKASSFESLRRVFDEIGDWCVERGAVATKKLLGIDGLHLSRVSDSIAELPGIAGEERPLIEAREFEERMCQAVTNILVRFAKVRPIVLVIDDLQWTDALTRRWLAGLEWNRPWQEVPLLVVVAGRYGDFLLDALTNNSDAVAFRTRALDARGVEEMVCDMIALPDVPSEFVAALVERSDGYPTRVAQWMHEAVRRGVLHRVDGEWMFAGRALDDENIRSTITIDTPIAEILRRRIERLPAEVRAALDLASVVGVTIENELFEALRGRFALLDRLVTEGFLEEVGRGDVRFVDAQARDIAHAQLSAARRAELHEHVVEALRSLTGVDEALMARHIAAAGEPGEALSMLASAALVASRRGEFARAALLYGQYFDLRPDDATPSLESVEARARNARALLARGEKESASRHLSLAETEIAAIDDTGTLGIVQFVRGTWLREQNQPTAAIAALDEAFRCLRDAGRHEEARMALLDIGNCWCRQGRFEVGRDVFQRVYDSAAEENDVVHAAEAVMSIGLTLLSTREYGECVRLLARAATNFHELEDLARESYALLHLGMALTDMGDYTQAVEALHGAYEIRYATGDTRGAAIALMHLGHASLELRQLPEAIEILQSSLPVLERVGERMQLAVAHGYLGEALGLAGEPDAAMDQFRAALVIHRELPYSQLQPYVLVEMAKMHRRMGLYADAQRFLVQAREFATDDEFFEVAFAVERARLDLAVSGGTDVSLAELGSATERMRLPVASALGRAIANLDQTIRSPPHDRVHGEVRLSS